MTFLRIRLLLVPLLLLANLSASAQAPAYKSMSDAQLYEGGRERLLKGRDLEKAIDLLSALTIRKPQDADYQVALGCACVARLTSLHCAAEDSKIVEGARGMYQRRVKIWQQMQDDPAFPLFGKPQPVAPIDPITPDDGKGYDPADSQMQKRLPELAKLALHSFHEALRLDRFLTAKHRDEIEYTCGWGLLLLYRSAKESIHYQDTRPSTAAPDASAASQTPPDDLLLKQQEIIACFQACTASGSKNADYWQSLAFAYAPDYITDDVALSAGTTIAEAPGNRTEDALKSLQHALSLPIKRGDPDLLYQAALVSSVNLQERAAENLKKLTQIQTTNAVNFYLLAAASLKQAEHLTGAAAQQARQEALSAIESGNQAPQYYSVAMLLPVPKLLAPAWNYHRTYGLGLDSHCLDALVGFLSATASEAIQNQNGAMLMRCGTAMLEMGLNALRHYDGQDLDAKDLRSGPVLYTRAFMGMICCGKGYKFVQKAAVLAPDPANTSAAEGYGRSAAYWQAWDKALTQK